MFQSIYDPIKSDDLHDVDSYINAYIIPTASNIASMIVLGVSLYQIRRYHKKKENWSYRSVRVILHLTIFTVYTMVVAIILVVICLHEQHITENRSIILDCFSIAYNVANFVATGFMLYLTWTLSQVKNLKKEKR